MPGGRPKTKAQPDAVKSVAKVLDLLEQLGAARRPISVSDLARAAGFNVSTAFRLMQTLAVRGYAEQEAGHRGYRLGPRVFQLAGDYLEGNDLATLARAPLEGLRDEIGETVYLVIFRQGEIVQLCKADGQHVVSASIRSAQREPAYCTATGKVLLAGLELPALQEYLGSVELRAYTAQTITRRAQLEREIAAVRVQGYALDVEEYAENLCCLSVPVRDPKSGRTAAAVSVAMPKIRFKRTQVARWRGLLDDKAGLISQQLALVAA